jgi:hypothetical protein
MSFVIPFSAASVCIAMNSIKAQTVIFFKEMYIAALSSSAFDHVQSEIEKW